MTKEQEKYFEEMFEMMNTQGWTNLIEHLEQEAQVIDSVNATVDEKDLYFRKGKLAVIGSLLSFREQLNMAYEDSEADA